MTELDRELMRKNIAYLEKGDVYGLRVSAEHYLWLAGHWSTLQAVATELGGEVDGHPTSHINVLQRVRSIRSTPDGET